MTLLRYGLIAALTLSSRTPQEASETFDVSSEASLYEVRGRVTGSIRIESSRITVVVRTGSIIMTGPDSRVEVQAIIAGASGASWKQVAVSGSESLGKFVRGERRALQDSVIFRIRTSPRLDLQRHWLVFEFTRADGSTSYACSDRNLAGPDSLASLRAARMRSFYAAAC